MQTGKLCIVHTGKMCIVQTGKMCIVQTGKMCIVQKATHPSMKESTQGGRAKRQPPVWRRREAPPPSWMGVDGRVAVAVAEAVAEAVAVAAWNSSGTIIKIS